MTTLSILIPHFNDPDGFALTLRSIEAQTWKGSREVIVCDDGSKPENFARLEEVAAASPETVRVLRNPQNRGRPFTRNVLLDSATGKYTTWCDSGDEYYPEKIELQLQGLYLARFQQIPGSIWCTCNSDWQWQGSRKKKLVTQDVGDDQMNALLLGNLRAYLYTVVGTTQSFRDVGYFDLALPRLQDLEFFMRFVIKGGRMVLPPIAEPLCVYHKTDVGRHGQEVLQCQQYIYRKHAAVLLNHSRRFRRNRQFQAYQLAARFTNNNADKLRTAAYLGASALHNPIGFGRWLVKSKGRL